MPQDVALKINGRMHKVNVEPETPLLYVLRNDIGLSGAKFGCGLGQCGACTVLMNGSAIRSCQTAVGSVGAREIVTIEGLGSEQHPHPLQRTFLAEQAAQCGYCINGMIMTAAALLAQNKRPSEAQLRAGLAANLCRCGTHGRILRAIQRAAKGGRA
jgi:nicotinate dehydrogenase subunit A